MFNFFNRERHYLVILIHSNIDINKYDHRIGWWEKITGKPFFKLMVKTMVSCEDFPQQTNPMIWWMWYHMPMDQYLLKWSINPFMGIYRWIFHYQFHKPSSILHGQPWPETSAAPEGGGWRYRSVGTCDANPSGGERFLHRRGWRDGER